MNRYLLILLTALTAFGWNSSFAQNEVIVDQIEEYMSKGQQPGFELAILDAEPDDVEETWIKLMKKQGAKITNSKKLIEIFADNASIPGVSKNSVDLYAIASKVSYGTRLTVFVEVDGSFISSGTHPEQYQAMETYLKSVAHQEAIRVVDLEMETQMEILEELNKELNNFIKSKDSYTRDIEKAEEIIRQRELDIEENIKAQETKRAQITIQEEIIETVRQKRVGLDGKKP